MSDRLAVMNDGKFEQIGAPEEVYDDPESRFVADFLGTANIFDGTVSSAEDGYATVDCGESSLRSTNPRGVEPGDEVSVIVRPERFDFESATADGGATIAADAVNAFDGEITFKRHLGSSVEFHLETDGGRELVVVRRSGTDGLSPGDRVTVTVPPEDCRIVEA